MIREFFYLRKSDRTTILVLLAVLVTVVTAIFFVGGNDASDTVATADSTSFYPPQGARPYQPYAVATQSTALFPFDPNTADSTQLLRLGLQPWQVRNIYKYRAKGGVYRRKEDFARLYGLTVKDYRRLEPYIRISADYRPAATLVGEREHYERDTLRFPVKLQADEHVVLNRADTAQLRRVPGIGVYYAKEIVRYGHRLGGYVSVEQLDEIDDFPQESKKYFVVEQPRPQQLNVNQLTLQQLRRHPYINFYQAKAIVDYRRLRGPITDLRQLRLSKDFTEADFQRLEPYVAY